MTVAELIRNLFQGDPSNRWKGILNAHMPPTDATIKSILLIDGAGYSMVKEATPVNAVAATGTLTSAGACAPAVYAASTLTTDNTELADGNTVTIGAVVYRFKDTPAQAYDVKRHGTTADTTMGNLIKAINGTGTAGVEYFAGTLVHPYVFAGALASHVIPLTARVIGTAAVTAALNALPTSTTAAHLSFPDTTFGGGTGASTPGVTSDAATVTIGSTVYTAVTALAESYGLTAVPYQILWETSEEVFLDNLKLGINATAASIAVKFSTGTLAHVSVTAGTNSATEQPVTAKTKGTAANAVVTTTTLANYSWNHGHLGGAGGVAGVDGTVAPANAICADASYLYHTVAANTVADTNWRRISLGTAF